MPPAQNYGALPKAADEAEGSTPAQPQTWRKWLLVVPALAFFGVLATTLSRTDPALRSAAAMAEETTAQDSYEKHSSKPGWYFYKIAYAAKNNSMQKLYTFMNDFSYGENCEKVSLGCTAYKITCTYSETDSQLHYVVAPEFYSEAHDNDGMGVSGWIDAVTESFGDFSSWSPFMHEKATLLLPQSTSVNMQAHRLAAAGYPVMRRRSYTNNVTVGHVLTPVGGKVWEFVGELTEDVERFPEFAEDECPTAQQIDADVTMAAPTQSIWLGGSTSASDVDSEKYTTFFTHLRDLADIHIHKADSGKCAVRTLSMINKEESIQSHEFGHSPVTMKYVHNGHFNATSNGKTVKMYEDYIDAVHHKYLTLKDEDEMWENRWHHWDHWLDTHVGIKFKNTTGCHDKAGEVNRYLLKDHIPTGKRAINKDGDHYYSGYPGVSMTMEYNTECHIMVNKSTDLCGCVHDNSNKLANDLGLDADDECVDHKF